MSVVGCVISWHWNRVIPTALPFRDEELDNERPTVENKMAARTLRLCTLLLLAGAVLLVNSAPTAQYISTDVTDLKFEPFEPFEPFSPFQPIQDTLRCRMGRCGNKCCDAQAGISPGTHCGRLGRCGEKCCTLEDDLTIPTPKCAASEIYAQVLRKCIECGPFSLHPLCPTSLLARN